MERGSGSSCRADKSSGAYRSVSASVGNAGPLTQFQAGDGQVWLYPKGGTGRGHYVGPYRGGGFFRMVSFGVNRSGEEIVLEFAPANPPADLNSPPPSQWDQISHLFNEPGSGQGPVLAP